VICSNALRSVESNNALYFLQKSKKVADFLIYESNAIPKISKVEETEEIADV